MSKKTKTAVQKKKAVSEVNDRSPQEVVADADQADQAGQSGQATLCASIEEMENKITALENKLLRARADYANLQRTSSAERSQAILYANAQLVRQLLPILDDFERSLSTEASTDEANKLLEGNRLVYQNIVKVLTDSNVRQIEPTNEPFDPTYHEAVMRHPSQEHPPNTVLEVVLKGYCIGDRVIRPAKVVIAEKPDESE